MKPAIHYAEGYKYQLKREYSRKTPIFGSVVNDEFYSLDLDGTLHVRSGYAWDGPSGPTIDSKSAMRPSLEHDVFCQMMNRRQIPFSWQATVHDDFRKQLLADGMWSWRAWYWHKAVVAADAGNPDVWSSDETILTAP